MDPTQPLRTDRRGFLQLTAVGAVTLTAVSAGASLVGCAPSQSASGFKVLRPGDVELFRAMIPAVMRRHIAADDTTSIDRVLQSFDTLLDDLSDSVVDVLRQAFDVMSFAPTRSLLAGQWSSWASASPQDAERALVRLRDSSIGLLNAIYAAIVRMVASSYYLVPELAYRDAGYPGPPQRVPS